MKRLTLLLACFFISMGLVVAQTKQVSGTITDENGEPVIGASVIAKGATTAGAVTDMDGKFSFSVPESVSKLIIKYIGYVDEEINASANVHITLKPDTKALGEVVVTAMGISRSDKAMGYAMVKVDPNNAVQKAEPDLLRSLNGKIPGVQVNAASSVAGSATKVTIRGSSSINGNNDPLYVVDGIPYSNIEVTTGSRLTSAGAYGSGISTLDPNDIEDMVIQKGAAAAALYGSRAANGVILITTKSGAKKTRPSQKGTEVTLTASYAAETPASLPEYQNMWGAGSNFMYSNANGSWGGSLTEGKKVPTYPNYYATYPNLSDSMEYKAYPNNVKDLFRTGGVLDLSTNISSYNDKGNYGMTVSHTKQDGFIPYSDFERNSFSVGGNQKLDNGIRIGGTLTYSRSIQNGPFFGAGGYTGSASSFARTLLLPRNFDATSGALPYETPNGANLFPLSGVDHPLWSWKNNTINTVNDRTVTSLKAGYDFTKWLSFDYTFGWNQYEMNRKQVTNVGSTARSGKGYIMNDDYKVQELESVFLLTFKQDFGSDYNVKAALGHNVNQRTNKRVWEDGTEMIFKEIYNVDNTQTQTAGETYSRRRLWALFADVTFGYKNFAYLNASLRNDHSSTLPVDNNSYFYPAFTGSFLFTEAFNINSNAFNYGKLRIAWGKVGSDASPYYKNGTFLGDTPFDSRPIMLLPTTSYDPKLKPEFTSEFEVGTELKFFQNRVGIDFSWYNRTITNQIAAIELPRSTGSSRYYTNLGEINNKGVEIGLSLTPVELKNSFKWNLYATFTQNKSLVVSLDDSDQITLSTGSSSEPQPTMKKGFPYGFLRGTVIARDNEGNPLVNPATGSYIVATDLGDLGDPNPDFRSAVTNTFSFKGITFSFMFDMSVGGVIVSGPASDMLGRGVTRFNEDRMGTRILPGVLGNPNTKEPYLDENGHKIKNVIQLQENDLWFASSGTNPTWAMNGVHEFSTFDATVFHLSEISLGYDLPKKWLKKTFIGSATLAVIARNLWHYAPGFPKYSNYDPGSNTFGIGNVQGIDRETAPTTKRVGINLKLTF